MKFFRRGHHPNSRVNLALRHVDTYKRDRRIRRMKNEGDVTAKEIAAELSVTERSVFRSLSRTRETTR